MWILKSSTVEIKMILNAKIAVKLTLHLIGYMISVSVFMLKLDMNPIQVMNLVIVPICYSLFLTVIRISLNKKYPNYDWDSEMIVVKQSLPVIVTGIIGMIVLITPIFLNWVLNIPITFVLQVVSVVLLVITMGVYITMSKSNFI
ncbi:hypothetical protein [Streptococcus pseudopneumoniae]|uniref:hypothetical protein n=1 Tax=Streptococcus pseudopneumoniae TaxID=257758 RepID=UPI003D7E84A9